MTDKERKDKIKQLRAQLKAAQEENKQLREALTHGKFFKDIESVENTEEFDIHCIRLNITMRSFIEFANTTRHFLISTVDLDDRLTEEDKKLATEWYMQWFDDATHCRDIVERLKTKK